MTGLSDRSGRPKGRKVASYDGSRPANGDEMSRQVKSAVLLSRSASRALCSNARRERSPVSGGLDRMRQAVGQGGRRCADENGKVSWGRRRAQLPRIVAVARADVFVSLVGAQAPQLCCVWFGAPGR